MPHSNHAKNSYIESKILFGNFYVSNIFKYLKNDKQSIGNNPYLVIQMMNKSLCINRSI